MPKFATNVIFSGVIESTKKIFIFHSHSAVEYSVLLSIIRDNRKMISIS